MFLLSFVERLKHRKVKIFTDSRVLPELARELSFGGFEVHTVCESKHFSCLVFAWYCLGSALDS